MIDRLLRPLRVLLAVALLGIGLVARAQVDVVYVYGTVKDESTAKKLEGITVTVYKNGTKSMEVVTNANGKYEFNLDYGSEFKIVYGKPGMVSKNIELDTRNVSEEDRAGGHALNIEMNLFAELPGVDFSILQQPIGKAKFDANTDNMSWDLQYTAQIRSELDRLKKEYEDKKKREAGAEAEYTKLMGQGEAAMTSADYKKAVESFTGALALKANDAKATARLSDAKMKLDELEGDRKKNEEYAALLKEADNLFGKKDYTGAKAKYEAASAVKDEETYPKQKAKECQAFIDDLARKAEEEKKAKELEAKYQATITAADAAFKGEKYEDARTKYTEASGIKPGEQYPKDQLTAIAKKLDEQAKKAEEEKKAKELEAKYQAAITAADAAFKGEKYEDARAKYTEASGIKPDERYPKDQLAAIDQKLDELAKKAEEEKKAKALDDQYKAVIASADEAYQGKDYDQAKAKYTEALGLKPAEKYPKDQLAAIDKAVADLAKKAEEEKKAKELDEQYKAVIAAGDAAFQAQGWDQAKAKYTEALGLKPAEKYPKDQLAAIDKALADLAKKAEEEKKAKELDARYQQLVDRAEELFTDGQYEAAKGKYQEALAVKPAEERPKERIVEIDAKLAELARKAEEDRKRKELDDKYSALITTADKDFDAKKLADALNGYKNALALKPDEQYPKDRIAGIEQLMDADAKAKAEEERLAREKTEREQRYNSLVAAADQAFTAKRYEEARTGYTDALAVKPGEQHPTDRLAEIQRLLDEIAARSEADRLKAAEEAAERERLAAERRDREAAEAEKGTRYQDAVARADVAFDQARYDAAREGYTEALGIKPDEQYPKDRLAAIEQKLAEQQQALSDAAAADAERRRLEEERRNKEAADAEAARLAAEEQQRALNEQQARDEQYRRVIADADARMGDKDYGAARDLYTQALDIQPGEVYPQSKIEQIDMLLADQERKRREEELAAARNAPVKEAPRTRENTTIDIRKEQEAEQFMREAREREEAEKYERIKKLKADVTEAAEANASQAAVRQGTAQEQNKAYIGSSEQLFQGSEAQRKRNAEEVAALKGALEERQRTVAQQGEENRDRAYADKEATVAAVTERDGRWRDRHAEQVRTQVEEQQAFVDRMTGTAQNGEQRSRQAREQALDANARLTAMQQRGTDLAQRERDRLDMEKQALAAREQQLVNRSQESRMAAKEQLDATPVNQPRSFDDYNRNQLAGQYPQGVTEESLTQGNKVIIRRIVVQGNKADEYTKVIAKWGTFYFKNGQSITEQLWSRDTEE